MLHRARFILLYNGSVQYIKNLNRHISQKNYSEESQSHQFKVFIKIAYFLLKSQIIYISLVLMIQTIETTMKNKIRMHILFAIHILERK